MCYLYINEYINEDIYQQIIPNYIKADTNELYYFHNI